MIKLSFFCMLPLLWADAALAFKCTLSNENGPSLYWSARQINLVPSSMPGQDLTAEQLQAAVEWGAAQWTGEGVEAPDEECSDFEFGVMEAQSEDLRAGYDWHNPDTNENIVVFRRGEDHDEINTWFFPSTAIAMTTVTFVHSTGEILDADIELNDQDFLFTDCDPETDATCDVQYDLKNTVTHEMGHVLGLDHPSLVQTGVRETTMYGAAPHADLTKRVLSSDDIAGLCALYPIEQAAAGNCGDGEREEVPDINVVQVQGCSQTGMKGLGVGMWSLLVMLGFCRRGVFGFAFFLMCGCALVMGCFDRTTNTWENNFEVPLPKKEARPFKAGDVKGLSASFFEAPQIISSPARGRLGVIHLQVEKEYPALMKLTGKWGSAPVSTMPWDKEKRLWQVFFGTPVGETAQERALVLDGVLRNGKVVRFAKKLLIDEVIYGEETLRVSKKYIAPKRAKQKRIKRERELLKNLWGIDTTRRYWKGNFKRPSANSKVTGEFGVHRVYNNKRKNRHLGVDWDGEIGDKVMAAQNGRVMLAQELFYSGKTMIIDHGRNLFTLYFHLSEMKRNAGDMVYGGQVIGHVGASGQVTGPHLHFAAKLADTYIDPGHLLHLDFSQDPALEQSKVSP